jgi:DNA-binding PadR family transcriptional regulator
MFKSKHRNENRNERRQAREAYWHEGGGGGRGHRGGNPHRGGGRRGRLFDQGDLRLVMLDLIAEAPRHGYEIIKSIEEKVGGAYSPSPGVVYPTLTLLEEMGLTTVKTTDGARKLYAITPDGQAHLDENRATLDGVRARISKIGEERDANSPHIERAVENLRTALRLRLERGLKDDAAQTTARAIADALDAAAKKIEQS